MAETDLVLSFTILDRPEAPGGKRAFPVYFGSKAKGTRSFSGRVSVVDRNPAVSRWRDSVFRAARPGRRPLIHPPLDEPLIVKFYFSLPRPRTVNASRRPWPCVRPDTDNLVKGTKDAITNAALWRDDSLVVQEITSKAYAGGWHVDGTPALGEPGCVVEIHRIRIPGLDTASWSGDAGGSKEIQ